MYPPQRTVPFGVSSKEPLSSVFDRSTTKSSKRLSGSTGLTIVGSLIFPRCFSRGFRRCGFGCLSGGGGVSRFRVVVTSFVRTFLHDPAFESSIPITHLVGFLSNLCCNSPAVVICFIIITISYRPVRCLGRESELHPSHSTQKVTISPIHSHTSRASVC